MQLYFLYGKCVLSKLLISICVLGCCAYRADVYVEENGIREMKQFEIIDEEVPPFETFQMPTDEFNSEHIDKIGKRTKRDFKNRVINSSVIYTGVKVTGIFSHNIPQSLGHRWKSCFSKEDGNHSSNSVVTVERGESVFLPCHHCDSYDKLRFEPRQWIKLDSFPDKNGLYRVREVLADMHDDKNRNRLVINLDHTLHFKIIKTKDAGSYFCKAIGDTKETINTRKSWTELNDWLRNNVSLGHFYHIDVLDLNKEHFIDVTDTDSSNVQGPEVLPYLNILVQTRWTSWGECSVCGEEGIRKRIGLCIVKKLNFREHVSDMYLDHVLDFAHDGILCKSGYLKQFSNEQWLNRSNEVRLQACNVPCAVSRQKRDAVKRPEMLSSKKPKKVVSKKLRAGDYLILVCPGSSIRSIATWVNGTKYLPLMAIKNSTNKRVTFDFFGNLHFAYVVVSDSSEYSCWIKKKMKRRFEITVVPNFQHLVQEYTMYLSFVFAADFAIFLFLTVIKIIQGKRQVRKRNSNTKKSTSSQSGSEDDSNDTE